ncbi:MAG: ABC transporter ATP-binding protein [Candidatus Ranarchaeia archaeon]|jgi:energy-coupling factor transport system ATP-binding protein
MVRPIIELKDVTYTYPEMPSPVLKNVNLTINEGEMALIVGPSGCGKTTLALTLNGVVPKKLGGNLEGKVKVHGLDVSKHEVPEMASHVSLVFQNPDEQLAALYVEDEVAFGPENLLVPADEILERVNASMEYCGITELRDKVVHELSGGQKQRLAIASALAMNPKILVLDSPISNIDPIGAVEILPLINKLRQDENFTVVAIEHVIDDMVPLVDKIMVMSSEGTIVEELPTRKALEDGLMYRDKYGLWVPQAAETILEMRKKFGLKIPIPLTSQETIKIIQKIPQMSKVPLSTEPIEEDPDQYKKAPNVIEVENLSYQYPTGTLAVDDASFTIKKGQMVAIVGQNGSGKTTTALNLIGILKPTSGRVLIEGKDNTKMKIAELAREIAYVFQYPEHQFVTNKVRDEVEFSIRRLGLPEEEIKERADLTLKELGLTEELQQRHPYNLSVGQKRRLSVACMTITEPAVIVLDEPTYGQDAHFNAQLMQYMYSLHEKGTTILFITHSMRTAAEYSDKVVALHDSRKVYEGGPKKFFSDRDLLKSIWLRPPAVTDISLDTVNKASLTVNEYIDEISSRF